jgi:DNA-binding CsgD family transcriptional regulator
MPKLRVVRENKVRLLLLSEPVALDRAHATWIRLRKATACKLGLIGAYPVRRRVTENSRLLTPRQEEVLHWMAMGVKAQEIARKMEISVKTVESHRLAIIERTGIRDVPGLVRYALKTGTLPITWLTS